MDLWERMRVMRMKDPADGELSLESVRFIPTNGGHRTEVYELKGLVSAPKLKPVAVDVIREAPGNRKPFVGQKLPVRVDRARPSRLTVLWDETPTIADLSRLQARQSRLQARQTAAGLWDVTGEIGSEPPAVAEPATATVLGVRDIAKPGALPINTPAGLFEIEFEITRASGEQYTMSREVGFATDATRERIATLGAELSVLVDPHEPKTLFVEADQPAW